MPRPNMSIRAPSSDCNKTDDLKTSSRGQEEKNIADTRNEDEDEDEGEEGGRKRRRREASQAVGCTGWGRDEVLLHANCRPSLAKA